MSFTAITELDTLVIDGNVIEPIVSGGLHVEEAPFVNAARGPLGNIFYSQKRNRKEILLTIVLPQGSPAEISLTERFRMLREDSRSFLFLQGRLKSLVNNREYLLEDGIFLSGDPSKGGVNFRMLFKDVEENLPE